MEASKAKLVPEGIFHISDDQTEPASDSTMAELFGTNWADQTFGQLGERLNMLLTVELSQSLEYVKEVGWMRSNDNPTHTVAVWTSLRQSAQYLINKRAEKKG